MSNYLLYKKGRKWKGKPLVNNEKKQKVTEEPRRMAAMKFNFLKSQTHTPPTHIPDASLPLENLVAVLDLSKLYHKVR